jgi:hypothetical protein
MTVQEAKDKRDKLEHDILGLLTKYENETSLSIEKVELEHMKPMGSQKRVVLVAIPVTISI